MTDNVVNLTEFGSTASAATAKAPRPTMRDVAEAAQVSFKTVSRVVNNESGVTDALTQRVEAAVATLGYRPDDRARNLRSGKQRTASIGFVQVDAANPFFSAIFRGLEDVARAHGCLVLSGSSDRDPVRENALIETFVDRRVDGLVVASSTTGQGVLKAELDRGTPIVFVDRTPADLSADVVRSDHRGGAKLATEHLLRSGHERVAFLGRDAGIFSAIERRAGFDEAMLDAGIKPRPELIIEGILGQEQAELVTARLLALPEPPTAIFSAQNFITMGAVRALHLAGLQNEVAQVGFDDIEFADLLSPGISVVPQQPREIGRLAGLRLFARINGEIPDIEEQLIHAEVLRRGSGEIEPPA